MAEQDQSTAFEPEYNAGHASSQAIAKDVRFREPVTYRDPLFASGEPSLNHDEAEHFKEHGFVVKRGLIEDPGAFSEAEDHLWRMVPRDILRRDDPSTWYDNPHEKWTESDAAQVGWLLHTNWKMRSRGPDGIGTEAFLVDRIANHRSMLKIGAQFLGRPLRPARRVRGIYGVLPLPRGATGRLGPHGDYMASQLSAMVIVNGIRERSGGFTVWPGSHKRLHMSWDRVNGSTISGERTETYPRERDAVLREITPIEFTGSAGDVIFWHPRILHSAGVNYSAERDHPSVRIIVPCDYQASGNTEYDDLEYGPGRKFQYWVDTRNYREDVVSTESNMWSVWGI